MSYDSNNKDYSDYFKALENRLEAKDNISKAPIEAPVYKEPKIEKRKGRRISPVGIICILMAIVISITAFGIIKNGKNKDKNEDKTDISSKVETEPAEKLIKYKFTESSQDITVENDAESIIIVNTRTHEVVASREPKKRMYPASLTKIMTLLVASENVNDYDDKFTMTFAITDPLFKADASVAGFSNGEEVSVIDLMYGAVLPSGADAAIGLAIMIAGSEEKFVELMNKRVETLGLKDTHFTNVSGLHNEENYSTAYDFAVILEKTIEDPICKKVLSTYQYTTAKTPQHPEGILLTSTLFAYMYGNEPQTATIMGGKTGYVNESKYCIASFGENNTSKKGYIVVTLKNSSLWPAFKGQIALYKEYVK